MMQLFMAIKCVSFLLAFFKGRVCIYLKVGSGSGIGPDPQHQICILANYSTWKHILNSAVVTATSTDVEQSYTPPPPSSPPLG